MTYLVTTYPIDATHQGLVRGDPVAIPVQIMDEVTPTTDPATYEARDITGTFWRAHIRRSEDWALLTKWTVTITDASTGQLEMALTSAQSSQLEPGCCWDLEQVDNGDDDDTTTSIGTYWKATDAVVILDVSHG